MLNFLLFVILFFIAAAVIGAAAVLFAVRRGLGRLRRAMGGSQDEKRKRASWGPDGTYGSRAAGTDGRCTVTDLRDPAVANRRIFADDEGEYVDFREVKDSK